MMELVRSAPTTVQAYFARQRSGFTDQDAMALGPEIARANHDPSRVVERARDLNSPLHQWFEWDDAVAADQFRLLKATHMVRSIQVVQAGPTLVEPVKPIALIPVRRSAEVAEEEEEEDDDGEGDEPRALVLVSGSGVLERAKRELEAFYQRYVTHQTVRREMEPVFDAIEDLF